jgi:hypothetical protein
VSGFDALPSGNRIAHEPKLNAPFIQSRGVCP